MTTETKLYAQMTVDEQLRYVTELAQFADEKLPRLEQNGRAWERSDRKDMETGLALLAAFQFARDYVNRTLYSGDYARRVYRMRYYVDKIKVEIGRSMTITDAEGKAYALVRPTVPQRRRGRPSREEANMRRQGIEVPRPTDKGMEAQIKIAQLVGLDIRVAGDYSPREKNNAELAVERAARRAEEEKLHPSLFAEPNAEPAAVPAASPSAIPAAVSSVAVSQQPQPAPAVADSIPAPVAPVTAANIAAGNAPEYRLHLDQKAPFLTDELKPRVQQVRDLRRNFEIASERAKLLAEQGKPKDEIAPYCTEAAQAIEQVEQIYDAIDVELATVYYRLQNDEPYRTKWMQRFGFRTADDINQDLMHDLRLHYRKVQSPEFDLRIRTLIEQESPEYMERVKAEEARKEEIAAILKYLKRQDKPNTLTRRNTARERFQRLTELLGEKEASDYRPLLTKIEEDYDQNFRAADEARAAEEQAKADRRAAREAKKQSKEQAAKEQTVKETAKETTKRASKGASKKPGEDASKEESYQESNQ